jgi:hypothetical protein
MRWQRGNVVVAFFLIALGGWIILSSLGVPLPGLGQIWPVLLIVFGLAMLVQSTGGSPRDEGLITVGTGALLTGGFLFLFTLGVLRWSALAVYWPVFPIIGGLSFFALYLRGGMRDSGLLPPAFAIGGVGVVAFPFTLGAVENQTVLRVARFWPLFVLLLLAIFLFRPRRKLLRPTRRPAPRRTGPTRQDTPDTQE